MSVEVVTTHRAPVASVRPGGSAGLGFAKCPEITALQGGTLKVQPSDLGGASFRFVVS